MNEAILEIIIEEYQRGSNLLLIAEKLSITTDEVKEYLIGYKNQNIHKRSFNECFKKLVAERDISGTTRKKISEELDINPNTVKKFCEQFGQAIKERATSDNNFTKIERELDMSTCPTCSHKVLPFDENVTYCKSCGDEYEHFDEYVLRVNWEYID